MAALAAQGRTRSTGPEEVLFREGDRDCDFFVVLDGRVAAVEGYGTPEQRVIAVHDRGRFLGELSLLTGEGCYYSAVALDAGEVIAVPVDRLRELVAGDPAFGDLVLRAYLLRRSILIGLGSGLRIIGSRYSADARRVRDFAARNRLPFRWLDLEADPSAEAALRQVGLAPKDTPLVIVHGRLLRNPGNAELAAAVGLPAPAGTQASCDLLVVGSGPAGLSAAVYGASEGMRVIALDGTATGARPAPPHASRTTSGSHRASPAPSSRTGRSCRRGSSAPGSRCPPRPPPSSRPTATTGCTSATAAR
jgi:thioredoxin reductase (NADPH)